MQNLQQLFDQTQENYELIPAFIEQLLQSDVFCLGSKDANDNIQFRVLETPEGEQAIPFFLSLEMLLTDLGDEVTYIALNTKKLFQMTQGATLVLNPTSEISKEFLPDEVKSILDGFDDA